MIGEVGAAVQAAVGAVTLGRQVRLKCLHHLDAVAACRRGRTVAGYGGRQASSSQLATKTGFSDPQHDRPADTHRVRTAGNNLLN